MDEGTRQSSPAVGASALGREDKPPEQLEQEIAETREQLGDTVEALASKTDVKGQAKDRASALKESAQQKRVELSAKLKDVTPASAAAGAQRVGAKAKQDPLPLAVGDALLVGFIIGRLSSR